MSVPKYHDRELNKANMAIHTQLQRYLSACKANNNYVTAVEESIDKQLIPDVEDKIISDSMRGGEHPLIQKERNNGGTLMIADNVVFANYAATKGLQYDVRDGATNLAEEARILHLMIQDYVSMPVKDFADKHFVEPKRVGDDKLIQHLQQALGNADFVLEYFSTKGLIAGLEYNEKVFPAIKQYWDANPKLFPPSEIKDGCLYFGDMPVKSIVVSAGLRRETENEDLKLHITHLEVGFDDDKCLDLLLELSDETKKAFGKEFTEKLYPEALRIYEEHRTPKTRSVGVDLG